MVAKYTLTGLHWLEVILTISYSVMVGLVMLIDVSIEKTNPQIHRCLL